MKIKLQHRPKMHENADAVRTTGRVDARAHPKIALNIVKEIFKDLNKHVDTGIKFNFEYSPSTMEYNIAVTYSNRR